MALVVDFYTSGTQELTPALWVARADDHVLLIEHGTGWTFDADHVSLTSLNLGVTELTATGYARKPVVTSASVWSAPRWSLPTAAWIWTSLGTAEGVAAMVAFRDVGGVDASSVPLWALYDDGGAAIVTLDGTDLTVTADLGVSG